MRPSELEILSFSNSVSSLIYSGTGQGSEKCGFFKKTQPSEFFFGFLGFFGQAGKNRYSNTKTIKIRIMKEI